MDDQTTPPTEPAISTPDPVLGDSPVAEPPQAEPAPTPATPVVSAGATTWQAPQSEPLSEPITETPTAQMGRSEPLPEPTPEQALTPTQSYGSAQPEPTPAEPVVTASQPMPAQAPVTVTSPRTLARLLLQKAQAVIQFRKQKKLTKIMALFLKKKSITNDEVEKLLHVSDATATRYLSELEKQGKIKQTGKTGHAVTYTKV